MNETQWKNESATLEVLLAGRFEWQGRVWELGATPASPRGCLLVFREEARPDEFFFLARRSMGGSQQVFPEAMVVHEPHSLPVWRESLKLSLEHGAWGRLMWFDSKLTQREGEFKAKWQLFLLPDGRGAWKRAKSTPYSDQTLAPFRWETEELNLKSNTASEWLQWTRDALKRDTDLGFAVQFARLIKDQKFERAVRWKNGTLADFERVCQWIGQIAVERWDERDNHQLGVDILLTEDDPVLMLWGGARRNAMVYSDTARAEQLWVWAYDIFAPTGNSELAAEHESVAEWLRSSEPVINIEFKALDSHHERIEILGQLLSWARNAGVEEDLLSFGFSAM